MYQTNARQISMAAILLTSLPLLCRSMAAHATVNLTATKQVIDGFGASSARCGKVSDNVMSTLHGDLGYNILRVRIEEGIEDNLDVGELH